MSMSALDGQMLADHFANDTEFADWAQNRARHTLGKEVNHGR
jgi:hypothetical protein